MRHSKSTTGSPLLLLKPSKNKACSVAQVFSAAACRILPRGKGRNHPYVVSSVGITLQASRHQRPIITARSTAPIKACIRNRSPIATPMALAAIIIPHSITVQPLFDPDATSNIIDRAVARHPIEGAVQIGAEPTQTPLTPHLR